MPPSAAGFSSHPSPEQLADFSRGEIDEQLADEIERHLGECATCLGDLERTRADDRWIELLRLVGPPPGVADPDRDGAAARPLADGYELGAVIGRGGMGVVHRAIQVGVGRQVALKMIAAGRDASPILVDRFRREVEAAASLNHPAIVPIYDVGVRDGVPFYAMELMKGGSLADRLASGPLPVPEAATLIEGLARAIGHAHRHGVVHRDLKPSNILYNAEGVAKVADFGLAKRLDAEGRFQTGSSQLLGTPAYMAPEQTQGGDGPIGPAVDLHALGAILFECLTGRLPFEADHPLGILERIRNSEPSSPAGLRPGLPRDLCTICLTCLEKDPGRRYPSAEALADDLARWSRGETILARPAGRLDRAAKWARRRPAEATLAAFLALAMLGTILGLLVHQDRLRAALARETEAAREAERQRGNAEAGYREAHETIRAILDVMLKGSHKGTPRLAEAYRAQAEAALPFYDRALQRVDSSDPRVQHDTARAALEAGNLQIVLGHPDLAERNLAIARKLLERLLADRPDDQTLVHDLVALHNKFGTLFMTRDPSRALASFEAALGLARRRTAASAPGLPPPDQDTAWCEHQLGAAFQNANQHDRAIPHYERAAAAYERLLKASAPSPALEVELAQTLVNLGLARSASGSTEAAVSDFRRAEALLNRAISAEPRHIEAGASRADLYVNWGLVDRDQGRLGPAIARFDLGLRDIEPRLAAEPNIPRLKTTAMNLHGARAIALERARRYPEAAVDWQHVVALTDPGPFALACRFSRLLCLARAGDLRTVVVEANALEQRPDLGPTDRYNLACVFALAVGAAPPDSPERRDLRSRALKLLRGSFLSDPKLRDNARQDPDLAPLADDPEFRRAIAGP